MTERLCKACKTIKPLTEFLVALETRYPGTKVKHCNDCAKARMTLWRTGLKVGKERITEIMNR
jgi:hypothetical protein